MTERPPASEGETRSPEQQLIKLLKERGVDDIEARAALDNWVLAQEKIADEYSDLRGRIEVDLKKGRLYFAAGYINEAFISFEAARMQAWNEGNDELALKIMRETDDLEAESKNKNRYN